MTWTWSQDPATSDLDAVRFHLQDTDSTDPLMSDEEIQFVIDQWVDIKGSNLWAASVCADRLAAKFAREVSVGADGVSVAVEALQQKFQTLAASLRDEYKQFFGTAGVPSAGGTLFNDNYDSTIKPLSFAKAMHDNSRVGQQDFGGSNLQGLDYTAPEDAL